MNIFTEQKEIEERLKEILRKSVKIENEALDTVVYQVSAKLEEIIKFSVPYSYMGMAKELSKISDILRDISLGGTYSLDDRDALLRQIPLINKKLLLFMSSFFNN